MCVIILTFPNFTRHFFSSLSETVDSSFVYSFHCIIHDLYSFIVFVFFSCDGSLWIHDEDFILS